MERRDDQRQVSPISLHSHDFQLLSLSSALEIFFKKPHSVLSILLDTDS